MLKKLDGIEKELQIVNEMMTPPEEPEESEYIVNIDNDSYIKICQYMEIEDIDFMGIS